MRQGSKNRKRIMAVSSGGGHWVELLRISTAFEGHDNVFVTVDEKYRCEAPSSKFFVVSDATRWNKLAIIRSVVQLFCLMVRFRPDVIVSTGALPGYIAIRFGKLFGARTVWLDSIANANELSMSGRLAGQYADLWLTQWAHLATPGGARYSGAVL